MEKVIAPLLVCLCLHANVYDQNCLPCHSTLPVDIDKFFYRYLLKHSSETRVKAALTDYLKNPDLNKTILPEGLIARFGIKAPTELSDSELKEAIDTYWDVHKVFGKLK